MADPPVPPNGGTTILAAGDIATWSFAASHTAALLGQYPNDPVLALGDNAYYTGSAQNYHDYFEPTWGAYKPRLRPIPGNHEYLTPNAADYYAYFGEAAADPAKGYYAFDLDASWRVAMCNSEVPSQQGSPQWQWLADDFAAHTGQRYLVTWHRPRFSSGMHGSEQRVADLFQLCYDWRVSIILGGHEHNYERLAPAGIDGQPDPAGPRSFVIGTGGVGLRAFDGQTLPITEQRFVEFGVVRFTLTSTNYTWQFLQATTDAILDQGTSAAQPIHQASQKAQAMTMPMPMVGGGRPLTSSRGSTVVRHYVDAHKRHYVVRLPTGREVDTAFPLRPPPGHDEASYEQACQSEAFTVAEELLDGEQAG